MAFFDFITSDPLRNSLERDFEELIACMKAGAWKAVHVIAGSLIQATLADCVISTGKTTEEEALRLPLSDLLEACRAQGVVSPRTVELAGFIIPYTDFLSPSGRLHVRVAIDETSARIAQALLEIVISEVSSHKQEQYSRTAEHTVTKILTDPFSSAILAHLVGRLSRGELERLLTQFVPKAFFEAAKSAEPGASETLDRLENCYRTGFELAPADLKRLVVKRFIEVLEEESEFVVQAHQTRFFRGSDLAFLTEEERAVVKAHLFATLDKNVSLALVNATRGIGGFLKTEQETRAFFVPLVMSLLEASDETFARACFRRAVEESRLLAHEQRHNLLGWIVRLRQSQAKEGRSAAEAMIGRLEASLVAPVTL